MRTVAFTLIAAVALYIAGCMASGRVAAQSAEQAQAQPEAPAPAEDSERPPCLAGPVVLKRFGVPDPLVVSLTDCEQRPHRAALPLVSALALPRPAPSAASGRADTEEALADGAVDDADAAELLNPELLVRLQQLAARFPDRPIEVVSGLRARARAGSRHRSGDALDVRIEGVDNEELSSFARTLEATGVGYYPNSTFVHVDVRAASAYWVDRSGPGEQPEYVRTADAGEGAPDAVPASTSAEAEQAAITGQVERALIAALDDVHGPELPVADAPRVANEMLPAETSAPAAVAAQPDASPPSAALVPVATEAADVAGAAETVEAAPAGEAPLDPPELDAELEALLERALIVMRQADAAG